MTETKGNSMFCGPEHWTRDCRCSKHRQSRVHKTYCFPEVSVNKYFITYQESKKRKNKANFIRKYMKYFINFLKNIKFNYVHNVIHKTFARHSRVSAVQRSRVLVMAHVIFLSFTGDIMHCPPRALMRGRQSNFHNLT